NMRSLPRGWGSMKDSPDRTPPPLNKPLRMGWRRGAPRQGQQGHVMLVPFTDRFRAGALERVFDRLGLANGDMQAEQRHGDRISPFVKGQSAQAVEQHRAGKDDQRIGEDEIF